MDPALGHLPFRVRPEEDIAGPGRVIRRVRVRRIGDLRRASVFEFNVLTIAAPGAGNQHQWATAAAPCSSISAPVVNRSSVKGPASGCGSPYAIVCAKTQPAPGVALNPPVPQPQLMKRFSIGVRPRMGEASGET